MIKASLAAVLAVVGCGSDGPEPIAFGAMGSLRGDAGKGGFRFGAASAATQIEDQNPNTDWYAWTLPPAAGGLGKSTFVGEATRGYSMAGADAQLVSDLGLDSYRFSIEWARIEPAKDQIDRAALAHYRTQLENLRALGIRPLVTLHHFSNPVWLIDPRNCGAGCGLGSDPSIPSELAAHAGLLARELGDLVDEWGTLNEPVNYLLSSYGTGGFPPGKSTIADPVGQFMPVVRDYIAAHAAMYSAIREADTVDADGDGDPAAIGLSVAIADLQPARDNQLSTNPDDVAARDRAAYVLHYLFIDSILTGGFDADLDGAPDEQHPEWAGTLDWLGLQYYFRTGVTAETGLIPVLDLTPCIEGFDFGACLRTDEPTYCVPRMGYEARPDGLTDVLRAFSARYPALPLVITESGIATDTGVRRAENIVRVLEAAARARDAGVDLRGYYHWSLTDNFEWSEGFGPRFGLYSVDYATYARTATAGADVLGAIAKSREVTSAQRAEYGGSGPMTPESGYESDGFCVKVPAP